MLSTTFLPKPCFQFDDKESALIYDVFTGKIPSDRARGKVPIHYNKGAS